jgi:hypothetical protein
VFRSQVLHSDTCFRDFSYSMSECKT